MLFINLLNLSYFIFLFLFQFKSKISAFLFGCKQEVLHIFKLSLHICLINTFILDQIIQLLVSFKQFLIFRFQFVCFLLNSAYFSFLQLKLAMIICNLLFKLLDLLDVHNILLVDPLFLFRTPFLDGYALFFYQCQLLIQTLYLLFILFLSFLIIGYPLLKVFLIQTVGWRMLNLGIIGLLVLRFRALLVTFPDVIVGDVALFGWRVVLIVFNIPIIRRLWLYELTACQQMIMMVLRCWMDMMGQHKLFGLGMRWRVELNLSGLYFRA